MATKIIVTNFIFLLIFFTFTCHYINLFISKQIHKKKLINNLKKIDSFLTKSINKTSTQSKNTTTKCTFSD